MSDRLKGKVAIITGCNSGIGFATVKLFLQEGAKVVGTDIRVGNALKFAEEHPDDYTVLRADATEEADWEKACQTAVEKYGKLTTICNIAGIVKGIELPDVTKESFLKMQEVNAYSTLLGMQIGYKYLEKGAGSSIVNTGSMASVHGDPYCSSHDIAYSASKAGIRYMTRYAAWDYGKDSIRVNAVIPGGVITPILSNNNVKIDESKPQPDYMTYVACPPYFCEAEDLGWGYVYLASDEARCVTGIDLVIDCGWTAK